ncbi:MAG: anti-sigma factor [Panacagrimonas sp.]
MRYDDNPELLRQLAAEYAIGTLRGAARRRFEDVLDTSEEARLQRDFWEQRLAEFGQILRPVSPPTEARSELLRRATLTAVAPAPWVRRSTRRRRRALWAYAAGFATAASLVLAFLLGQRWTLAPQEPSEPSSAYVAPGPVAMAPEDLNAWPIYAGQVRMPGSSIGWLISITPDHRQIIATAADDFFQAGRAELHLWCMVAGAAPVALGVLPSERDANVAFEIPASVRGQSEVVFAISLEPQGRTGEGGPSAPVLNQSSTLLDSI